MIHKSKHSHLSIFVLLLLSIVSFLFFAWTKTSSVYRFAAKPSVQKPKPVFWQIRSIDTMKFSRDLAREKANDIDFEKTIGVQVENIAKTGATHVAIGTPYDEEFLPFLKKWVSAARKNNLKVWFRGNLSGWEEWFEYKKITRAEHTEKITQFILKNADLFSDGDLFSSCPECENGAMGDPRQNGNLKEYREFLINEYRKVKTAFLQTNKKVISNLYSMNGDVARLVMDKETTKNLDGTVTIDHYVLTKEQVVKDIDEIAKKSGGKIVLGEFGAPIPDIHGKMSDQEQAQYLDNLLFLLKQNKNLSGVNYWTSTGSSTEIWDSSYNPKPAVSVLTKYFQKPL